MFQLSLTSYGQSQISSTVYIDGVALVAAHIDNISSLENLSSLTTVFDDESAGNFNGSSVNIRINDLSSSAYQACTILLYQGSGNNKKVVAGYSHSSAIVSKAAAQELNLFLSFDASCFTHGCMLSSIQVTPATASLNADGIVHIENESTSADDTYSVYSKAQIDSILESSIQTVNNATLTIQKNGSTVNTFTANASSDVTVNITVPTTVASLSDASNYVTTNTTQTITGEKTFDSTITITDDTSITLNYSDEAIPHEEQYAPNDNYAKLYTNTRHEMETSGDGSTVPNVVLDLGPYYYTNDSIIESDGSPEFLIMRDDTRVAQFGSYVYLNQLGRHYDAIPQAYITQIGDSSHSSTKIYSDQFIKHNGTSSQFLKADGSVDSTSYLTSSSLSNYVTINTTQTITGSKTFNSISLLPSSAESDSTIVLDVYHYNDNGTDVASSESCLRPESDEYGNLGDYTHKYYNVWAYNIHGNLEGSASSLSTNRHIDGVNFNGTSDIVHFGECTVAASTQIKDVTIPNFNLNLVKGSRVIVKFTNANSASNPQLRVNTYGTNGAAKPIVYRGTSAVTNSSYFSWQVGSSVEFVFDGTNWAWVGFQNYAQSSQYSTYTYNFYNNVSGVVATTYYSNPTRAIIPYNSNTTSDLGTASSKWRTLYLSTSISDGTNTFSLPSSSGTLALTSDIQVDVSPYTISSEAISASSDSLDDIISDGAITCNGKSLIIYNDFTDSSIYNTSGTYPNFEPGHNPNDWYNFGFYSSIGTLMDDDGVPPLFTSGGSLSFKGKYYITRPPQSGSSDFTHINLYFNMTDVSPVSVSTRNLVLCEPVASQIEGSFPSDGATISGKPAGYIYCNSNGEFHFNNITTEDNATVYADTFIGSFNGALCNSSHSNYIQYINNTYDEYGFLITSDLIPYSINTQVNLGTSHSHFYKAYIDTIQCSLHEFGTANSASSSTYTATLKLYNSDTTNYKNGISCTGNFLPSADHTYNVGSPSLKWNTVYTYAVSMSSDDGCIIRHIDDTSTDSEYIDISVTPTNKEGTLRIDTTVYDQRNDEYVVYNYLLSNCFIPLSSDCGLGDFTKPWKSVYTNLLYLTDELVPSNIAYIGYSNSSSSIFVNSSLSPIGMVTANLGSTNTPWNKVYANQIGDANHAVTVYGSASSASSASTAEQLKKTVSSTDYTISLNSSNYWVSNTSILPSANSTSTSTGKDLGSTSYKWRYLYVYQIGSSSYKVSNAYITNLYFGTANSASSTTYTTSLQLYNSDTTNYKNGISCTGNFLPSSTNVYGLGSSTYKWKEAYFSGGNSSYYITIDNTGSQPTIRPSSNNTGYLGSSSYYWNYAYINTMYAKSINIAFVEIDIWGNGSNEAIIKVPYGTTISGTGNISNTDAYVTGIRYANLHFYGSSPNRVAYDERGTNTDTITGSIKILSHILTWKNGSSVVRSYIVPALIIS